jgi:UbiD family decarboxylase
VQGAVAVRGSEGVGGSYRDLREWLQRVDQMGELKVVNGANWNMEIAAITELARMESADKPALLFDNIKDYQPGFRVLAGMNNTIRRLALSTSMPVEGSIEAFVRGWKERLQHLQPLAPRYVTDGPVLENVKVGDDIDMTIFPTPIWHDGDGGRYLGTGSVTITADPESGWINLGTYRVVVHDRNTLGFYASPGKHGRMHREEYWRQGKPCPVVISFGHDPLLFIAACCLDLVYGESELEYAGAIRGEPIEVLRGEVTGLPIPAYSEIVIEGESYADEKREEGPFGEFTGYYASDRRPEPVIHVKRLYYRNNPIITGCPPARPPAESTLARSPLKSAGVWNTLERAGLRGIRGVCLHPVGASFFFTVVSIKQLYAGHAKQAAMLGASVHGAAYMARFVVIVDDDIDPFNLDDVMWAICTRVHPHRDIEINARTWSGPLDPNIPPGGANHGSVALIDATRPWEWKDQFPPAIDFNAGYMAETRAKWASVLGIS